MDASEREESRSGVSSAESIAPSARRFAWTEQQGKSEES